MANVTVKSLAAEINIPVDYLIYQFASAGINKTEVDYVTQQEKEILLTHLNHDRVNTFNKLTVQRKKRSTLNISTNSGKRKQVKIEVRKKRTYVQCNPKISKGIVLDNQVTTHIPDIIFGSNNVFVTSRKELINEQSSFIEELKNVKKTRKKVVTSELKHTSEKQIACKVEENTRHSSEEGHFITKKNKGMRDFNLKKIDEDNNNYHIANLNNSLILEEENGRRTDNERRSSRAKLRFKSRSNKLIKQKKTNYLHEIHRSEYEESYIINRGGKSKRNKPSSIMQSFNKPSQIISRDVIIGETITIAELANKMAVKSSQVITVMMKLGAMVTINQVIDQESAQLVAEEMGHNVILRRENELESWVMQDRDTGISMTEPRAPVVTIMGHVDHGKTSLIDYIRSAKVAGSEAGGITQHIGAYHVKTDRGMITFLDTPGHAAFTAMRARGAGVTDIIILVVAADDGVMLQTVEAVQHAQAAKVPIIVAVNKIDKLEANSDRVKNELIKYGITPEEWGGENQFINISATLGIGINNLLDAVLLQAEFLNLNAVVNGMASGVVIESFLDKGKGPVATILIREGTLHCGDIVLCGLEYGRIRAMRNEINLDITSAGPSIPVEIFGLSGTPIAGDILTVVRDEKKAREVALYRQGKFREVRLARQQKSNMKHMLANINENDVVSELNIVLKTDVQGTAEAISDALRNLSTDGIKVRIIGSSVGSITETDAILAAASKAILLGFNVRADCSARRIIESENLDFRYYSVIYELINEVKQAINGMLIPEYKQEIIGLAEVRDIFISPKYGHIAGCMVINGIVKRNNKIRILRNNTVIFEGELESLRRFKDDVNEVRNGVECGIGIKNYNNVNPGDIVEVLSTMEIQRTIF